MFRHLQNLITHPLCHTHTQNFHNGFRNNYTLFICIYLYIYYLYDWSPPRPDKKKEKKRRISTRSTGHSHLAPDTGVLTSSVLSLFSNREDTRSSASLAGKGELPPRPLVLAKASWLKRRAWGPWLPIKSSDRARVTCRRQRRTPSKPNETLMFSWDLAKASWLRRKKP